MTGREGERGQGRVGEEWWVGREKGGGEGKEGGDEERMEEGGRRMQGEKLGVEREGRRKRSSHGARGGGGEK